MGKLDFQEVKRLINKLEEKFNKLDITSEAVRENVPKDFSVIKDELKKNSSEERIIDELKILLKGLRDYSIGNSNMNPLVYDLDEYIRSINISSDY